MVPNAGLIKNQSIELNNFQRNIDEIEEEQDEIMNNFRSYIPRNFSKSVHGMESGKDSSVKITFKANPKPTKSIISCDNLHPLNSYEIHDGDSDEEYSAYLNFTMDQQIDGKNCKIAITNYAGMGMFGFTLRQRFKPQNFTVDLNGIKSGDASSVKITFISQPKWTSGKWYIGSDIVLPVNTTHGAFKSSPISYNSELKLYEVYLFFNEVSAVKNCSFEAVNELGKGVQDFSLNGELSYFTKYMPGSFDLMVVY